MTVAASPLSVPLSRRGFGRALTGAALLAGTTPLRAADRTALRFTLDWRFEGPAALFLAALDKGYFAAEGLDVTIEQGTGSRETVARVATGGFDAGFGDVTTLIRARDDNPATAPRAVMMVYDRAPFAIVGRRSRGITENPRSLEGKILGAPAADGAFAQWPAFRTLNRIDEAKIKFLNIGFPVREPMLASGEVDAAFGYAHSAYLTLKARGVPADDIVLLEMADHGLLAYGNAVMVSPKLLAANPEAVKALLRALTRGVRDTVAAPAEALQAVLSRNTAAKPELEAERLQMVIARNLLTPWVKANGLGGIDTVRWQGMLDQIADAAPLKDRAKAAEAFAAGYLPAEAERLF